MGFLQKFDFRKMQNFYKILPQSCFFCIAHFSCSKVKLFVLEKKIYQLGSVNFGKYHVSQCLQFLQICENLPLLQERNRDIFLYFLKKSNTVGANILHSEFIEIQNRVSFRWKP